MESHSDYYVVCCKLCKTYVYNTKFAKHTSGNCTKGDLQKVSTLFLSHNTVSDYMMCHLAKRLNCPLRVSVAIQQGIWLCQF
jgi:hypothetical protein